MFEITISHLDNISRSSQNYLQNLTDQEILRIEGGKGNISLNNSSISVGPNSGLNIIAGRDINMSNNQFIFN